MADTYLKVLGKVLVADGSGNAITSTTVGPKQALDVNVTSGDIIIDNPTIIVDITAFGGTPDSVLIVGSEDGTALGTRHVARVDTNGQLETLNMNGAGVGAVNVQDGGNSLTVDAIDLDIRNLVFATDKVDASGSALGANSGIDIGDVTVNNAAGGSAVNVQDGGNSLTVDAVDLDIRNLVFATDKVDISGSILGANSGVDIGDVTVNNAAGASAVNIQDGGNSITVDGTLAVTQSTSPWVISGTVTANAGTNLNTSLLALESGGNLAAAAASLSVMDDWDESDRAKVNIIAGQVGVQAGAGAVSANTQRVVVVTDQTVIPVNDNGGSITVDGTVAATQSGTWSHQVVDGSGNIWGPRTGSGGVNWMPVINLEAATSGSSAASRTLQVGGSDGTNLRTLSTDTSGILNVNIAHKITYAAAATFTVAASPTDIFTLTGSATKTIRVVRLTINGTNTGNTNIVTAVTKRSTANSGGTSTTPAAVPLDSNSAAGTAVARAYTANPTLGTAVGDIRIDSAFFPTLASSNAGTDVIYEFWDAAPILRGTAEVLAINLKGTAITGTTVVAIDVTWTEE